MELKLENVLVKRVFDLQSGIGKESGKEWQKKEIIIETQGDYPKDVKVILWNKVADLNFTSGDIVTLSFDVESREWKDNWYTDIKAYKVEFLSQQEKGSPSDHVPEQDNDFIPPVEGADDLPF